MCTQECTQQRKILIKIHKTKAHTLKILIILKPLHELIRKIEVQITNIRNDKSDITQILHIIER